MTAQTDVNVLMLQRKEFDALLGPLQQLLDANAATYKPGSKKANRVRAAVEVSIVPGVSMCRLERYTFC